MFPIKMRPVLHEIGVALRSRSANYDYQKERFVFDAKELVFRERETKDGP